MSLRMRWFRSNRLVGAWLALLALAVQLIVSFGHVHPENFNSAIGAGSAQLASVVQQASKDTGSPATPSDHRGSGLPHDDCAICVSIYLAGSALIGQPPALAVPTTFDAVLLPPLNEFDLELVRYFSFRTRAPPAA
jgi:hypothetical protein